MKSFYYGVAAAFLVMLMTRADNLSTLQNLTVWFLAWHIGAEIGRISVRLDRLEKELRIVVDSIKEKA